MSDNNSKPGIPSWQRAGAQSAQQSSQQQQPLSSPPTEKTVDTVETATVPTAEEESSKAEAQRADSEVTQSESTESPSSPPPQRSQQPLSHTNPLNPSDFTTFTSSHPSSQPSQSTVENPQRAPPIITYPEFLSTAHQPPPLITASRLANATYATAGLAALCYGLGTYLLQPLNEQMTSSRHDFATHVNSKVDQMNSRLEDLLGEKKTSEINQKRRGQQPPHHPTLRSPTDDDDETSSLASDPTELYHRDMGTQTSSPLPTPTAIEKDWRGNPIPTCTTPKPPEERHTTQLHLLRSHFYDLLPKNYTPSPESDPNSPQNSTPDPEAAEKEEQDSPPSPSALHKRQRALHREKQELQARLSAAEDPQEQVKNLRRTLEAIRFAPPGGFNAYGGGEVGQAEWRSYSEGGSVWMRESGGTAGGNGGASRNGGAKEGDKAKKVDQVEALRKEIRGVKGVLLSSKRFPGAGSRPAGTGAGD